MKTFKDLKEELNLEAIGDDDSGGCDEPLDDDEGEDEDPENESQPKLKFKKKKIKENVSKPTGDLKKACWKGYTAIGMKKKNGRTVPNCVPVKESTKQQIKAFMLYKDDPADGGVNFDKIKVHNKFVRNTLNKIRKLKKT